MLQGFVGGGIDLVTQRLHKVRHAGFLFTAKELEVVRSIGVFIKMEFKRQPPPDIHENPDILKMPAVGNKFDGTIALDRVADLVIIRNRSGDVIKFPRDQLRDLIQWLEGVENL